MATIPILDFNSYVQSLQSLPYGKVLPTAIYLHRDTNSCQVGLLGKLVAFVSEQYAIGNEFNVIKFRTDVPRISFLCYPRFFEDAHPSLERGVAIDLASGKLLRNSYEDSLNPPILHRKELLLSLDDFRVPEFAALSAAEEKAGLYNNTAVIGFRANWERLLAARGLALEGHALVGVPFDPSEDQVQLPTPAIQRHRTALTRYQLSKPVKTLIELNQMTSGATFFDYGCGLGADVRGLRGLGFDATGWDPVHASGGIRVEADVVNLGYVLNVIEDPAERLETLVSAWQLTRRLLIVSALIGDMSVNTTDAVSLRDGIVTRRNTFQKHFRQHELHQYIEDALETTPVPVALGIFYVFRDSEIQQRFLESRTRRSIDWSSISLGLGRPERLGNERVSRVQRTDRFAQYQPLIEAFWLASVALGRLPVAEEFSRSAELCEIFGSQKRAWRYLLSQGRKEIFHCAEAARKADLLLYLAISNVRRVVPLSRLPKTVQQDIRAFFGSYKRALAEGLDLLHSAADANLVSLACDESPIGWRDDRSLYLHTGLAGRLPTTLRVLIACAELLYGDIREADILKIHKFSGKVTFLAYADFDSAVPVLTLRTKVNLRTLKVEAFDHTRDGQLLYFKERFLDPAVPQDPQLTEISDSMKRLGISESDFFGPSTVELRGRLEKACQSDLISRLGIETTRNLI